jgi:hypothetical protein
MVVDVGVEENKRQSKYGYGHCHYGDYYSHGGYRALRIFPILFFA